MKKAYRITIVIVVFIILTLAVYSLLNSFQEVILSAVGAPVCHPCGNFPEVCSACSAEELSSGLVYELIAVIVSLVISSFLAITMNRRLRLKNKER
jgi:ABC-type sugar transport system permease subunit